LTATLASPDTGQKVEARGVPSLLFNLAYGDVGRLSTNEDIIMRFSVSRQPLRGRRQRRPARWRRPPEPVHYMAGHTRLVAAAAPRQRHELARNVGTAGRSAFAELRYGIR
jgi:hypothetical protein